MAAPPQTPPSYQYGEAEVHDTHHVVPLSVYFKVFAALMVLLVLTLAAAAVDLGPLNLPIAMTIAIIKAVLIILYFMHVRYSSQLVWVFAGSAFVWLVIMFVLTMADYGTRGWLPVPGH
jgi:cytochrome c oxidase subunit IV